MLTFKISEKMQRVDPHLIYYKYQDLYDLHFGRQVKLLTRSNIMNRHELYLCRIISDFISDARIYFHIAIHRHSRLLVVREFSTYYFLLFAPILWPKRDQFALNINHNLNRESELRLISWLSRYFMFAFIGAGPEFKKRLPFIEAVPFARQEPKNTAMFSRVICFVGSRPEQCHPDLASLVPQIRALTRQHHKDLIIVGKNIEAAPDDVLVGYLNNFEAELTDALVVFLYAPSNYNYRHSGVFWEVLDFASKVIYPASDVLSETAEYRRKSAFSFVGLEDFKCILEALLKQNSALNDRQSP